jgi:hypothetical protein
VIIPDELDGKELQFYLWYPGKGECFFDDLTIDIIEIR